MQIIEAPLFFWSYMYMAESPKYVLFNYIDFIL